MEKPSEMAEPSHSPPVWPPTMPSRAMPRCFLGTSRDGDSLPPWAACPNTSPLFVPHALAGLKLRLLVAAVPIAGCSAATRQAAKGLGSASSSSHCTHHPLWGLQSSASDSSDMRGRSSGCHLPETLSVQLPVQPGVSPPRSITHWHISLLLCQPRMTSALILMDCSARKDLKAKELSLRGCLQSNPPLICMSLAQPQADVMQHPLKPSLIGWSWLLPNFKALSLATPACGRCLRT